MLFQLKNQTISRICLWHLFMSKFLSVRFCYEVCLFIHPDDRWSFCQSMSENTDVLHLKKVRVGNHHITQLAVIFEHWHDRLNVPLCPRPSSQTWFNLPPSKCNFSAWSSLLTSPPPSPSLLTHSSICSLISSSYLTPLFLSGIYCLSPYPSPSSFSSLKLDPDISQRGFIYQPAFYVVSHWIISLQGERKKKFSGNIFFSLTNTWFSTLGKW